MAITLDALKKGHEELNTKGPGPYIGQKNLGEEEFMRILPNSPNMKGLPYLKVYRYWLDKLPLISLKTFGKPCPIEEVLQEAIGGDDADAAALATNRERIKVSEEFWYPVLHLKYEGTGKNIKISVIDGMSKVLQAGKMLTSAIDDVCMHRKCQNGTEDLIADFEEGYNMSVGREKTGTRRNDVEYKAQLDDQWVVPARFREDIIDPYELAKSQVKGAKYQRAVIEQFLYGTEIPAAIEAAQKAKDDERKAAWEAKMKEREQARLKAGNKKAVKKEEVEDDEEDETPEPPKKKVVKEIEAPAKKKVSKPAPPEDDDEEEEAPFEENEDEDDDLDEAPAKKSAPAKKAAPAPAAKKTSAKPKEIDDDVDDDNDDLDLDDDDETPAPAAKKSMPAKKAAKPASLDDEIDDDLDFEDD